MPCSITDGPQFEGGVPGRDNLEDEDKAYELVRQQEIDNLHDKSGETDHERTNH